MVAVHDGKKRFFKIDPKLLKLGELGFFEKVVRSARELTNQSKIRWIDKFS